MKTIERDELKAKLDRQDDFKLIMAMHEWGFRAAHIPGSLHYNTVEEANDALSPDDEIVVYCTDPACVASQFAYQWLVGAGYTNVAVTRAASPTGQRPDMSWTEKPVPEA